MRKYHKIQTVYKRDPKNKFKTLLEGQFSLEEFEYLFKNFWVWTEKIDGTNIRIMFDGEKTITFGGKTDRAQLPTKLVVRLNEVYLPKVDIFRGLFGNTPACLYGEGFGAGIQKGGKYRPDQDFIMFDININDWWIKRDDVSEVAKELKTDIVPIVDIDSLSNMVEFVRKGFKSQWGDFQAEGLVARPVVELKARNGDRIITKLKCKDFK